MVLRMRLGASSTVTGAICSVKSAPLSSGRTGGGGAEGMGICPVAGETPAAATPASLRNSRLCMSAHEASTMVASADEFYGRLQDIRTISRPVSYTHLTLPTIYSV